jgi:hypothetical protein
MGQVVPILKLGVGHGLFIPLGLEPWGAHHENVFRVTST